jgi:predicted dehydrogenase
MKKTAEAVWGVIGAGNVCEKKSMPALNKVPHSRVKTVMRRNADACKAFAARHGIPEWTTDSNTIFHDPEINAVYISTPPDTHALYALKAAHAGKVVYVEKPMARNYHECQTMIDACENADVPLFVAYYRRALPHFLRVRDLIKNNKLGAIRSWKITFYRPPLPVDLSHPEKNWRVQPEISGGGHFHDLASHQLDLMDFFFGPVIDLKAHAENRAGLYLSADHVQASIIYRHGVIGEGDWDFACAAPDKKDEIVIRGDEGYVKFSTFEHARIEGVSKDLGQISEEFLLPEHIQMPLIRTIISELRGEGICPSHGESASRTSWLMDKICQK